MNMTSSTTTTFASSANPSELKASQQADFANPSTALVSRIQKNMQDIPADLDEEATVVNALVSHGFTGRLRTDERVSAIPFPQQCWRN